MDKKEFEKFMEEQMKEINIYKWLKKNETGEDQGNDCCFEWIIKYAKDFREKWEEKNLKNKIKNN